MTEQVKAIYDFKNVMEQTFCKQLPFCDSCPLYDQEKGFCYGRKAINQTRLAV